MRDTGNGINRGTKRVLRMVGMAHTRGVLEGIADYADHHGRWQHPLQVALDPRADRARGADVMIVEPHGSTGERHEHGDVG